MEPEEKEKPGILYIFLSRKFWATVLSMGGAVGVLNFTASQEAELVALIVAGLGAIYTVAVALEDGLKGNAKKTVVSTPSTNVSVVTSEEPKSVLDPLPMPPPPPPYPPPRPEGATTGDASPTPPPSYLHRG